MAISIDRSAKVLVAAILALDLAFPAQLAAQAPAGEFNLEREATAPTKETPRIRLRPNIPFGESPALQVHVAGEVESPGTYVIPAVPVGQYEVTATAKGLVLPAMVLIYVLSGTLEFAHNVRTGILPAGANEMVVTILYGCCILGVAKNGFMPFHNWLPSAMVAPTPVSALFHAVADR